MKKKSQRNKKVFGYDKSTISLWKTGGRPASMPLALKLLNFFKKHHHPTFSSKDINYFINATPKQLKIIFSQLNNKSDKNKNKVFKKGENIPCAK